MATDALAQSKSHINPLDKRGSTKAVDGAEMIKNIVTTETSKGDKRILEEAPTIDFSLIQDIVPPKSPLLLGLKSFFLFLILASFGSFVFFTTQLTDNLSFLNTAFDIPNPAKNLTLSNAQIINDQTELNKYRYIQLKAYLDEFSFYGDSYLKSYDVFTSQTSTNAEKAKAMEEISYLKGYIQSSLEETKKILLKDFTAPVFSKEYETDDSLRIMFEAKLKATLENSASAFSSEGTLDAKREYKNYVHTMNLIGNKDLKDMILSSDFAALDEEGINAFIKNLNSLVVNDLSTIQTIKENRIRWSDIMNEIYLKTLAVDSYYSGNYYDTLGGIRYSSYDFDSDKKTISIVGDTKRFDTTNFTTIVTLIEKLNESDLFENAEMRSFSKSGSLDTGYTASLRLNLGLEGMTKPEEPTASDLGTDPLLEELLLLE